MNGSNIESSLVVVHDSVLTYDIALDIVFVRYLASVDKNACRIGRVKHSYQSNANGNYCSSFGLEYFASIVPEGEGFTELVEASEVEP